MKIRKLLSVFLLTFTIWGNVTIAYAAIEISIQDADSASVTVDQPATQEKAEKKTDWMEIILGGSYLIGVFVLFPLVVYTNLKEGLFDRIKGNTANIKTRIDLSIEERNKISAEILEKIEAQLSSYKADDGAEMVTITKGKQARFMKRGLDYINTRLCPTEQEILNRADEFTEVYKDRTKREFTGSKWILGCAIGILVFMGIVDIHILLSSFTVIQIIGITFYYLSSRTPRYLLEKRMKWIGGKGTGVVAAILSALFAGMAAKHYVSINGGAWQRDHGSELTSSGITLIILFVVAMFVGFMVALFGILNFILNYSTSFLNPLKTLDKWYEEDYSRMKLAA
ncbi:MAG: hypothetical protein JW798_03990 [Prolixibacteraceae bacterium]|nr:hypothetical protein [Prolixibacteraceae bacterium]